MTVDELQSRMDDIINAVATLIFWRIQVSKHRICIAIISRKDV